MTESGDYICALTVIYWWPFYAVLNNYSSRSCKDFKKLMNLYYTIIICTHLLATTKKICLIYWASVWHSLLSNNELAQDTKVTMAVKDITQQKMRRIFKVRYNIVPLKKSFAIDH